MRTVIRRDEAGMLPSWNRLLRIKSRLQVELTTGAGRLS
jgi:hypothetical protein